MLERRAPRAEIDGLRARRLELRFSQRHVGLRGDAAGEPVAGEIERPLERGDGVVEDHALGVQPAQLEIVERQLGVQRQPHRFQIRGAGLRAGARRVDPEPDPSPDVRLVRDVDGQQEVRDALVLGGVGAIAGLGAGRDLRAGGHLRISRRPGDPDGRARLEKPRLRAAQRVVRHVDRRLESR